MAKLYPDYAHCPNCWRVVRVKANGFMFRHSRQRAIGNVIVTSGCSGGQVPPLPTEDGAS